MSWKAIHLGAEARRRGRRWAVLLAAVCLLAMLCTSPVDAGWPPNGFDLGGPISKGDLPFPALDGVGGWYVAWRDYRSYATTGNDVRLQHVTPAGTLPPGWPAEALPLCAIPGDTNLESIAPDGSGGVLLSWQDGRTPGVSAVYAQRVLCNGSIAQGWVANGVPVAVAPGGPYQNISRVAPDGQGGAFIVWEDRRVYPLYQSVFAQHLTATGQVASGWPPTGLPVSQYISGEPRIASDGAGGCYAIWSDARRGIGITLNDTYGQHLTGDGQIAPGWQPDGNLVMGARIGEALVPDGAGGFYAISTSLRAFNTDGDYWLARFTEAGTPAPGWPVGGLQLTTGTYGRNWVVAAADSMGGALVAWDQASSEGGDIMVTRIRSDGSLAPGWTPGGTIASDPTLPDEYKTSVTPDGMGGAYLAWQRQTDFSTLSFAQHVGSQGARYPSWPAAGIPLATTSSQFNPRVAHDGQGGALVAWEEYDQHFSVFAQRFVPDGIVATQLALASSDVRSDRITLVWQGVNAGNLAATVSRREDSGRWERLGTASRDAADLLRYEDATVSPGTRYAYRLSWFEDGAEQTSAEVWIDVPAATTLALEGLQPNPAVDAINVSFSLPNSSSATLDLLDLAGRRIADREVGSLGPGRHIVRLDEGGRVAPGVYWVRLRQGGHQFTARAAVMR